MLAMYRGLMAVEVIPCADIPYSCDRYDPADWEGEPPDFTLIREWEQRVRDVLGPQG